ncbi:MAG: DNA recombination protein RmuC [Bacteroidetes bacterium]|nr:MAG: DNA recombination protein RmuC [Bacteroidota bacterium]PIE88521.1 MAG: DNA recombination protein RmuC [Bacteroidota bacterium]
MDTQTLLLIFLILLLIINIVITLRKVKPDINQEKVRDSLIKFDASLEKMERSINAAFAQHRSEANHTAKDQREELLQSLHSFKEGFDKNTHNLNQLIAEKFNTFSKQQTHINRDTEQRIKEIKETVEKQLKEIRKDNTYQLKEMRKTVDEKLQKTLQERLTQSFETVGKQLQSVQEGLGEMKHLAQDVGGLKKVLSNVKMRGSIGEVQLSMLLEQILAPDQYQANVQTKPGSQTTVEFAIKLPGRGEEKATVWLPIDAKFPKDIYEKLQDAYEEGDSNLVQKARKELDNTLRKMAKEIHDKYLNPPNTTDFGIMFLPFEGIYAEVVKKATLLESLQRDYKIIVTGPTTLAAILNSLQIGFKTLAIQQRSSEVWNILGAVKHEFEKFGGMMQKAQKNIRTGLNQLDDVMGVRTRAIQRKLNTVTSLEEQQAEEILQLDHPHEVTDEA